VLATIPNGQLIQAAIAAITPPKIARPSSFVLHAPLELMARVALLPHVRPDAQLQARRQIAALAVRYIHAGPSVEPPKITHAQIDTALPALIDSLHCGDVDSVDSALLFLTPRLSIFALRKALVDEIAPLLGAAGHASYFAGFARTIKPRKRRRVAARTVANAGSHARVTSLLVQRKQRKR